MPDGFQECSQAEMYELFLECYHREDDELLDHIIIGDETWVLHYTPRSKQQSQERYHAQILIKKKRKFKKTRATAKIMAALFGIGKAFS
jgi:hypothetical protein